MILKSILYLATIAVLAVASAISHGIIDSKMIYLLSDSALIDATRVVAASVIALLLVIRPPRPMLLRIGLTAVAVAIIGGGLYASFTYQMGLLDMSLALLVGVVCLIEAVEITEEDVIKHLSRQTSRA